MLFTNNKERLVDITSCRDSLSDYQKSHYFYCHDHAIVILWSLTAFDTRIFQSENSIVYLNEGTNHTTVAVVYVIATCGPLFFSGYNYLIGLGVANLLGIFEVMYFKAEAFTSLWCLYAAIVSVLIYGHFYRRRTIETMDMTYKRI